jgi:glycosyltransferase involved in cell wall biosynthesis
VDNAIDADDYRRTQSLQAAKRAAGLREDQLCIGAIGRLEREKGFENLIEAAALLATDHKPFQVVIVGEGSQRRELARLIESSGLAGTVRLLGHRSDVRALYQAMDVFVLSSIREGLPNVLLEAMACRLPVVATSIAGVPSVIYDGKNGLLVPPGDSFALGGAIRRLFDGPELRFRLASAARETVERQFTFAEQLRKMAAVYERVLANGACPASAHA